MNVNEILYISKGGVKPTNNNIFSISLMDYCRKDYTKEFNYFMLSKEIQRIFPREVLLEQGMIEVDNPFTEDKMYKFKEEYK